MSPDGRRVAYVRSYADAMKDAWKGDTWLVDPYGSEHRPLVTNASAPRWSPDGQRLAYATSYGSTTQLHVRSMDAGTSAPVTRSM